MPHGINHLLLCHAFKLLLCEGKSLFCGRCFGSLCWLHFFLLLLFLFLLFFLLLSCECFLCCPLAKRLAHSIDKIRSVPPLSKHFVYICISPAGSILYCVANLALHLAYPFVSLYYTLFDICVTNMRYSFE